MSNESYGRNMRRFRAGVHVLGFCALFSVVLLGPAIACSPQVRIDFVEDSPDRFRINFQHGPNLQIEKLTIRLSGSAAGAFFEGDSLAAARSIKQPHPNSAGVELLTLRYETRYDADAVLTFSGFVAGRVYDLHSDLDDLARAQDQDGDHIAEGELAGATANAQLTESSGKTVQISGTFDNKGGAILAPKACV